MDIDITLQQPYTHAVVVESDMSAVTYNLGPVALIPFGEGRMFEVGDTTIAVFRVRGGQIYATEPWCPHRGGPLADGIVASGKVVCPLHGYMFELETGNPVHHECRKLRTYPVRLNDADEVLVTMRRKDKPRVAEQTPAECEPVRGDFERANGPTSGSELAATPSPRLRGEGWGEGHHDADEPVTIDG